MSCLRIIVGKALIKIGLLLRPKEDRGNVYWDDLSRHEKANRIREAMKDRD